MDTIIIEKKFKNDAKMEKELKGFNFVLRAVDRKAHISALRGLNIDGGLVVGTDGHRLHIFLTSIDIENGLYEIVSAKSSQVVLKKTDVDGIYPDYNKVIPMPRWKSTISCNGSHHSLFHEVYKNFANDEVSYNTDFLHDAYMDNSDVSIMKDDRNWSPLVMYDNDSRAAIVMPLKNN